MEKPKVVYIAGPITGIENYRSMFFAAEMALEHLGYIVLTPASLPDGLDYEKCMRIDRAMIMESDIVAFIGGWENSPGCRREMVYANQLGIPTKLLGDVIYGEVACNG